MKDFTFYFGLGGHHIISIDALDHLLFIAALVALFDVRHWKQLLILVTAFTIGHCTTLVLSTYDMIRFDSAWVEFLIPLTILITAVQNLFRLKEKEHNSTIQYIIALVFGLVHGMGFANTIRFMLAKSQDILIPLLSFNLGLEAGQILVVAALLLLNYFWVKWLGLSQKWWVILISCSTLVIAACFTLERLPW